MGRRKSLALKEAHTLTPRAEAPSAVRAVEAETTPEELREDRIAKRLRERGLYALAEKVARTHHVTVPEVLGTCRTKSIVTARHAFLRGLHDEAGLSWPEIGAVVERKHDNIIHASSKRESRARREMSRVLENQIAEFVRGASLQTYCNYGELAEAIASGAWRAPRGPV